MMASAVLERFSSLDETLSTIKDAHAREMQEARDARVAAEIEAELCRKLLAEANAERDSYMRVAVKLIAQFSTVEAVFADAKQLAIDYATLLPQPPAAYEIEPAEESASKDLEQKRAKAVEAVAAGGVLNLNEDEP